MTDPAHNIEHTLEDHGLRWEVLSHDTLPGGVITWLRVTPAASDLGSAMRAADLVIEETGIVALLRVCNPSGRPVLLPADLVVDGGKQARVVECSVIIPSLQVVDVPVRCVEAGRWRARDARTAERFVVDAPASTLTRAHLLGLKQQTMRSQRRYETEQGEVWKHVSAELHRTRCTSQTQSYTAFLSMRAERVAEARRLDIQPPAGANALALVRKAGVWLEVFPTREDMCSIVPTVVADTFDEPSPPSGDLDLTRVRVDTAIQAIESSKLEAVTPLPATVGDSFALDAPVVAGFALFYAGRVAHLLASVGC